MRARRCRPHDWAAAREGPVTGRRLSPDGNFSGRGLHHFLVAWSIGFVAAMGVRYARRYWCAAYLSVVAVSAVGCSYCRAERADRCRGRAVCRAVGRRCGHGGMVVGFGCPRRYGVVSSQSSVVGGGFRAVSPSHYVGGTETLCSPPELPLCATGCTPPIRRFPRGCTQSETDHRPAGWPG